MPPGKWGRPALSSGSADAPARTAMVMSTNGTCLRGTAITCSPLGRGNRCTAPRSTLVDGVTVGATNRSLRSAQGSWGGVSLGSGAGVAGVLPGAPVRVGLLAGLGCATASDENAQSATTSVRII